MSESLQVLAVCTHNRTRSVIMGALLQQQVERADRSIAVSSAGCSERGGEPPTHEAVRLLAARNIDVSGHLSHFLSKPGVTGADLIVTAEHHHVITIAGRWPEVYDRTFTLPEIVELGERVGPRGERTHRQWLGAVHTERPSPIDYLDHDVGEIADPTGGSPKQWSTCFTQIDDLTHRLIALL